MVDVVAMRAASYCTAAALDCLVGYFIDAGVDESIRQWALSLRKSTESREVQAVQSMHRDLQLGMSALSASINTISAEQQEGTAAILWHLIEVRDSNRHDRQLGYLKKATDAMNDIRGMRYNDGHPANVDLLRTAASKAEKAARVVHGNLLTKLQAYRLWVIAEYMKEAATRTCMDAKGAVLYVLGRVILHDSELVQLCHGYCNPQQRTEALTAEETLSVSHGTSASRRGQGASGFAPAFEGDNSSHGPPQSPSSPAGGPSYAPDEISATLHFLVEIMSSVIMMPPLDQDVSCQGVIAVIGGGMEVGADGQEKLTGGVFKLCPDAPEATKTIFLAMGKCCALTPHLAQIYPSVSSVALDVWEKGKERLAMDNLFDKTGGPNWVHKNGWQDKEGELGDRFGIAVENGHVTKIHLAGNNLAGVLEDDLADCEKLRELVLHDNEFFGDLPPRVRDLIKKPDIVVTGFANEEPPASSSGHNQPRPGLSPGWGVFAEQREESITASKGSSSRQRLKKFGKFFKESVGANMALGFAATCEHCGAELKVKKAGSQSYVVCSSRDCTSSDRP